MQKDATSKTLLLMLFLLVALVLPGYNSKAESEQSSGLPFSANETANKGPEATLELPLPQDENEIKYLGIAGAVDKKFSIAQINSQVVLIEVFSMYCPHCQSEAFNVNDLYKSIEANKGLNKKLKMIGIGAGNTGYEVNLYKQKYRVPFPLFSDEDYSLTKVLGAVATPTFVGIKINPGGDYTKFYSKTGHLGDINQFLEHLIQESGTK